MRDSSRNSGLCRWLRLSSLAALPLIAASCGAHDEGADGADSAQQALGGATDRMARRLDRALDLLQATPEQRQRLRPLAERLHGKGAKLRGLRREVQQSLAAALRGTRPDPAALAALKARVDAAVQELTQEAVDVVVQAHGVLSAQQRAQVASLLERPWPRHHGRGHGRGRGPCARRGGEGFGGDLLGPSDAPADER